MSGAYRQGGGAFHHLNPEAILSDSQQQQLPGQGKAATDAAKMVNFASNGDDMISPSSPPTVTGDSASVTGAVIMTPQQQQQQNCRTAAASYDHHRPMNNEHYPCDCCRIDDQPYSMRDFTPPGSVIHRSEVGLKIYVYSTLVDFSIEGFK